MSEHSVAAISAVAALEDTLRRGMYDFIRRARRPVSREEAAGAVGISRKLAAFHLDKLVDVGLLRARHEAVGGVARVGRKPKVYEPVDTAVQVAIPERAHDVLAGILIEAVLTERSEENARQATVRVAGRRGEQHGEAERAAVHPAHPGRLGVERALTFTEPILRRQGFEPARETRSCVRLCNCPFHPLAAAAPELVCGLNHAFLTGLLRGLKASTIEAVLAPRAGECCVELRAITRTPEPPK